MRVCGWLLPLLSCTGFSHPCESCHPRQVAGYLHTGMGQSLRSPEKEPDADFEHAKSKTRFLVRSNQSGLFQRMQQAGQTLDYRIDYVIGSGNHASCYLARIGDHLFESPICYYKNRGYDMAPGYSDASAPAYTRPITEECLLCHSGRPLPIPHSLNRYQSPAFAEEAISCDRCHGDPTAHLKRPVAGSIVNPRKLAPVLRDSVCEQCHLSGVVRVANPGKSVADFHPGLRLEDVFTTYVSAPPSHGTDSFKVVSQSEQLSSSRCARASNGRMWCGTCHDPHNKPADPVAYYRAQCLSCHIGALRGSHPSQTSNCISCHMPRQDAEDGGHTVFTDHRIRRAPQQGRAGHGPAPLAAQQPSGTKPLPDGRGSEGLELIAWREPASEFRERNLALAFNNAGLHYSSLDLLARSYGMLLEVQKKFPADPGVLSAIGTALLNRDDFLPAAKIFDHVIDLRPNDPFDEDNAGMAWLGAGNKETAARHLEKALALDPLLLPDIEALARIYRETGDRANETALMDRVHEAMRTRPRFAPPPR